MTSLEESKGNNSLQLEVPLKENTICCKPCRVTVEIIVEWA